MDRGFAAIVLMLISVLVMALLFAMVYLPTLSSLNLGSDLVPQPPNTSDSAPSSITTPIERAKEIKSKVEQRNLNSCPLGACEPTE